MAKAPMVKKGLSGKTTTVNLFYDGDKYKEPMFVGINGMTWLIKRGEPVEVPVEVAEVINQSIMQDGKTAQMIRELDGKETDLGEF